MGAPFKLRVCLPAAGFRWPEGQKLTDRYSSHKRRDRSIVKALGRHGGCTSLRPGPKSRAALAQIAAALTDLVREVRNKTLAAPSRETFDVIVEARAALPWALALHEDTVVELFWEIYQARGRWHGEPRYPFDTSEHGALAHALDEFHSSCGGGRWTLPEVELLEMAGGFDHEDLSEGEEEAKQEAEQEGGEAMDVDEDDSVREVREKMARLDTVQEEDEDEEML